MHCLPPALSVKYNSKSCKGCLGETVFRYLVLMLDGLHPPTRTLPTGTVYKRGKKTQKRIKMGWVGK